MSRAQATEHWPPHSLQAWRAAIRTLPIEHREALAPLFSLSHLRAARTAARHESIVHLMVGRSGRQSEIARQIHRSLSIYASGMWKHDRDNDEPHDRRNLALYRAMRAYAGQIPAEKTVRDIVRAALRACGG